MLGYPADHPVIGDKIINLHNEWETKSNKDNPLTNGIIGNVIDFEIFEQQYPWALRRKDTKIPLFQVTMSGDEPNEVFEYLEADY